MHRTFGSRGTNAIITRAYVILTTGSGVGPGDCWRNEVLARSTGHVCRADSVASALTNCLTASSLVSTSTCTRDCSSRRSARHVCRADSVASALTGDHIASVWRCRTASHKLVSRSASRCTPHKTSRRCVCAGICRAGQGVRHSGTDRTLSILRPGT